MRMLYEYFSRYWSHKNCMCMIFQIYFKYVIFNNFIESENKHVSNACKKNYFRVFMLINSVQKPG